MGARSSPEDGDIVIRHDVQDNKRVFVLATVPGQGQFIVHSRETALRHAMTAATRLRVRVWEVDSNQNVGLLADYRLDVEAV